MEAMGRQGHLRLEDGRSGVRGGRSEDGDEGFLRSLDAAEGRRHRLRKAGEAIWGTFARRETIVPLTFLIGLSSEFSSDPTKITQWQAYSDGTALEGKSLAEVASEIWAWLEPACKAAS